MGNERKTGLDWVVSIAIMGEKLKDGGQNKEFSSNPMVVASG